MKESLKKFREEADKLEKSESLQKARQKYQMIESETLKGSEALKKTLTSVQETLKATMEEVDKSEYAQKGRKLVEDVSRRVERTAESVSKQGEQLSQSSIFQTVSQSVKSVKEEIDESSAYSRGQLYKPPEKLRKRTEVNMNSSNEKIIEPNADASGVVLHKDSQWFQSWQSFKDNNQFVHKLFDIKAKYEESDHLLARATRTFTDKLSELFGGVFSKTEMSEVLTEIVRMDPTFDKEEFIKQCRFDIIPNILESMVRGDLDVLQDWCYEAAFNVLATPIRQAQSAMYKLDNRVLDINHVDIVAGKMMEQGPVLVLSFTAQQIMAVRDATGRVVEGDPEKIVRIFYVWAFCRDQTILDPRAAWRLIDLSASPMEQWL
jgi:import inner membrane translocase subunit TIM44